jgi:hypothetical protein
MPKKLVTKRALSNPAKLHLLEGWCLLGCELCSRQRAFCPPGVEPYTLNPDARMAWDQYKNELLAIWRDPEGIPGRKSGFTPEGVRGGGRWTPCFAEVAFDGVPLPKKDRTWSYGIKKIWTNISDGLQREKKGNSRRTGK